MPNMSILLEAIARGEQLEFLAAWFGVGAVFAALVFAFTAIAIPLMLDRGTDAITAMLASLAAVGRNLMPMLLWAVCIVALIGAGFLTAFLGLIITGPWVASCPRHASRRVCSQIAR
jgi:uncharacterized membrane protein